VIGWGPAVIGWGPAVIGRALADPAGVCLHWRPAAAPLAFDSFVAIAEVFVALVIAFALPAGRVADVLPALVLALNCAEATAEPSASPGEATLVAAADVEVRSVGMPLVAATSGALCVLRRAESVWAGVVSLPVA